MKRIWIPQAIATLVLLGACFLHYTPEYHALARAVCTGAFACLAAKAFCRKLDGWAWVLGFAAAVYNPWLPLHLTWLIWAGISVGSVVVAWGFTFLPGNDSAEG